MNTTNRGSNTLFIAIALAGAVTPIVVAVFARDRFWHEGVDGFLVAVGFSVLVARSEPGTWQRTTAKVLLILAGLTVAVAIALLVFFIAAVSKNGFPG